MTTQAKTSEIVWHDVLELPFFHTLRHPSPICQSRRSIPNLRDRKTALTEFALLGRLPSQDFVMPFATRSTFGEADEAIALLQLVFLLTHPFFFQTWVVFLTYDWCVFTHFCNLGGILNKKFVWIKSFNTSFRYQSVTCFPFSLPASCPRGRRPRLQA